MLTFLIEFAEKIVFSVYANPVSSWAKLVTLIQCKKEGS